MSIPLNPGPKQKVSRAMPPPLIPTVYPNLTPTSFDVPWGPDPAEVCDIYVHPGSGPRGVQVNLHFGGGVEGDHKQTAKSGDGGQNAHAWYVLNQPDPYDVVSVNYRQLRWDALTSVSHIAPWSVPSGTVPALYPECMDRIAAFFSWLTANASTYNWTDKVHVLASSHGGTLATLALLKQGLPIKTLCWESPLPDYRDGLMTWQVGEAFYGDGSQAAWDARAAADKEAISAVVDITPTAPSTIVPVFVACANGGNGETPYGSTTGGSIHDVAQWHALTDALSACGATHAGETYPRGGWNSPKLGYGISSRLFAFQKSHE